MKEILLAVLQFHEELMIKEKLQIFFQKEKIQPIRLKKKSLFHSTKLKEYRKQVHQLLLKAKLKNYLKKLAKFQIGYLKYIPLQKLSIYFENLKEERSQ